MKTMYSWTPLRADTIRAESTRAEGMLCTEFKFLLSMVGRRGDDFLCTDDLLLVKSNCITSCIEYKDKNNTLESISSVQS